LQSTEKEGYKKKRRKGETRRKSGDARVTSVPPRCTILLVLFMYSSHVIYFFLAHDRYENKEREGGRERQTACTAFREFYPCSQPAGSEFDGSIEQRDEHGAVFSDLRAARSSPYHQVHIDYDEE
jgi:hypothetical protein